jgi:hypothetical protein
VIRKFFLLLLFLFSCSQEPSVRDIEKALDWRYRWFGDVIDVRVVSMVKLDESTYFAQITYGVKFKRGIDEIEKEINEKLKGADLYKNLPLFVNVVTLNELVRSCGRLRIERGRVCYLTRNVELKNIRGEWVVRFM